MINFDDVWLPQIIGYAKLINSGQLEAEWLGSVPRTTSVTDPDELHEQIFDDLDANRMWVDHRTNVGLSSEVVTSIDRFLAALREMRASDAITVLASIEWTRTKMAAASLVTYAA